ncbi:MAG: glycosyl transferase family 2 [Candidatus Rokuibacteriota bacterium]|nr:MAG: glycosyl transferase family 2 [Candidatus Rokubacteria bacterium]
MVGPDSLRVAVVIPAYRAANTIPAVLGGIPDWVDAIYVVDDGSRDETAARVQAVGDTRVQLLTHDVNRGVGAAMVTGYLHALRHEMDICIKMDADGQMDPCYLSDLVEPLVVGRADYAKGNRFHDVRALRQMPFVRRVGSATLSFLIKAASGQWHIFDPTNGFTAVHRAALGALELDAVHPRYFFESSMLILLQRVGAVVEDVRMPARYGDETSHLRVGRTLLEFPWLLIRYGLRRIIWQYFVVDFNAVSLFLVTGVPLVTAGLLFGLYHWIDSYRRHVATPTGTIMLAALPLILGFQLLLQALVLDVQSVPRRPLQLQARKSPRIASTRTTG